MQQKMAFEAAMDNMPMAKGIVNPAFLEKNRVVTNRKNASPLGNFWHQNIEDIFRDF